jgi:hypothetical protein
VKEGKMFGRTASKEKIVVAILRIGGIRSLLDNRQIS